MSDLYYVAGRAEKLSGGAVRYQGTGSAISPSGARYIDGVKQLVWLGRGGGRTNAVAYYFGAAMEWTRRTGIDLSEADAKRLQAVRETSYGARGDWSRWELEGRADAYGRWESRNVLAVWSATSGVSFNVVRAGVCHDGDDKISFYDSRFDHTDQGQFVGAYRLAALRSRDRGFGLTLDGGVPAWNLDAAAMGKVQNWLDKLAEPNLNRQVQGA